MCAQERTTKEGGGFTLYEDQKVAGQMEAESRPLFPLMAGCRKRRWCLAEWWRWLVALLVQCYRAMSYGDIWVYEKKGWRFFDCVSAGEPMQWSGR